MAGPLVSLVTKGRAPAKAMQGVMVEALMVPDGWIFRGARWAPEKYPFFPVGGGNNAPKKGAINPAQTPLYFRTFIGGYKVTPFITM